MEDKKTPSRPLNAGQPIFEDTMQVASSTELTGMIPSMPPLDEEMDAYRQIYDLPLSSSSDIKNSNRDGKSSNNTPSQ